MFCFFFNFGKFTGVRGRGCGHVFLTFLEVYSSVDFCTDSSSGKTAVTRCQ